MIRRSAASAAWRSPGSSPGAARRSTHSSGAGYDVLGRRPTRRSAASADA